MATRRNSSRHLGLEVSLARCDGKAGITLPVPVPKKRCSASASTRLAAASRASASSSVAGNGKFAHARPVVS